MSLSKAVSKDHLSGSFETPLRQAQRLLRMSEF
jgi:hypothetical protein